jgi:hypothetical protein
MVDVAHQQPSNPFCVNWEMRMCAQDIAHVVFGFFSDSGGDWFYGVIGGMIVSWN